VVRSTAKSQGGTVEPTLRDVLADPTGLELFRQFSVKNFDVENVEFLVELNTYKNLPADSRFIQGLALFKKFIEVGSPLELNLDPIERKELIAYYKTGQPPIKPATSAIATIVAVNPITTAPTATITVSPTVAVAAVPTNAATTTVTPTAAAPTAPRPSSEIDTKASLNIQATGGSIDSAGSGSVVSAGSAGSAGSVGSIAGSGGSARILPDASAVLAATANRKHRLSSVYSTAEPTTRTAEWKRNRKCEFDRVRRTVERLIDTNSWLRFKASPQYEQALKYVKDKELNGNQV